MKRMSLIISGIIGLLGLLASLATIAGFFVSPKSLQSQNQVGGDIIINNQTIVENSPSSVEPIKHTLNDTEGQDLKIRDIAEGVSVATIESERNPRKPKTGDLSSQPVNIALLSNGTSIFPRFDQSFGQKFEWNRLIDNNPKTDLRLDRYLLKELKYTISFAQPHQVVGVSFNQPSTRNPKSYLRIVSLRVKFLSGNWSENIELHLDKDSGNIHKKLKFDEVIVALMINPEETWGGNVVFMGDIKVWVEGISGSGVN